MSKNIRTLLLSLPALSCMLIIFLFSSQNAADSSSSSSFFIRSLLSLFDISFTESSAAQQVTRVDSLQFFVRKGVHFSIYALLGFLCAVPVVYRLNSSFRTLSAVWAFAAIFAVSDEIHQYFVPGHSCEIRDMLIDSSGAALGVLAFHLLFLFLQYRKKKRKN